MDSEGGGCQAVGGRVARRWTVREGLLGCGL